jgi:hypothetical protein
MKDQYIKDFPRGNSNQITSLLEFLPVHTDHLNTINQSLQFIKRLREIATDAGSDVLESLSDVEKQGKLNGFLNLCILDFTVIYKNALSAIHLWDDVYSLRQGYLLIYEAIKTYNSHSKSLKDLANKTSDFAQVKFSELTEEIKKFRKNYNYDKDILEIRNHTIGHIENDPFSFYERISKFDEDKAFAALKDFASLLVRMLNLSDYIFINYTKKVTANSSLLLATANKYSDEINQLLDLLNSQAIGEKPNGS